MIPASFAPMLLKLIMPKVLDHFMEVFKLDKVLQYVEQPNELDEQVGSIRREMDVLRQHIIDLDKDSHPPIFSKEDKKNIEDRLKRIENGK